MLIDEGGKMEEAVEGKTRGKDGVLIDEGGKWRRQLGRDLVVVTMKKLVVECSG